jgi:hypothetical protein
MSFSRPEFIGCRGESCRRQAHREAGVAYRRRSPGLHRHGDLGCRRHRVRGQAAGLRGEHSRVRAWGTASRRRPFSPLYDHRFVSEDLEIEVPLGGERPRRPSPDLHVGRSQGHAEHVVHPGVSVRHRMDRPQRPLGSRRAPSPSASSPTTGRTPRASPSIRRACPMSSWPTGCSARR